MRFHLPSVFTSLRSHLVTFILLAVIPSFGVIVYSANQHRRLTANQVQRNVLGAARAIAAEQERSFENAHQFLVMLARVPQVHETNALSCNKFLAGLLEPLYADIGLVDGQGNLRCSALPPDKSLLKPNGAHHKRAIGTHDYSVGEIRIDKATGRALADLAFPLAESPAALRGVLVATLDLSWVTRITAQKHLYPGAIFTLLDGRGDVLLRYPKSQSPEENSIFAAFRDHKIDVRDTERTIEMTGADGIARLFAFSRLKSPVGRQAAYVVVDLPTATAFAEANRIIVYDLLFLGLFAALILTLAWCAANVFVLRRIQDIMDATNQVASGTLSARTKIPYGLSELGQLARAFDELACRLESRDAELRASAKKIHAQRQQQSALYDINLAITSTLDIASVLRILLKEIAALFPSCGASVAWINTSTGGLEPMAQHNLDSIEKSQGTPGPEMGLPLVVLARQTPIAILDARVDPRVINPEFFRFHRFISYLGLPMIAKDETLGVLSVYLKDERRFNSQEELEFLTALVNQAAMAIFNSRLFEQTRNQAIELERSNKIKDEFLGVMSHELRTPLNIIMNYAEALQMGTFGAVSSDQERGMQKIRSQAGHLLSLINGILEITKIESGTVMMLREPIDLVEFMADNRSDYATPIEKDLTLEWRLSDNLPVIESDRTKLQQILTNLIDNAIKFTDQGSVIISADIEDEGKTVALEVTDTGPGIPEDLLPLVFEKFRQIDSTNTRDYSGAGLGLYIVKSFAEILGGKVSAQSKVGEGSRFSVRFPVNSASAAPQKQAGGTI